MRFTVVHAADLHLDTPFSGLGEVAPQVAEALREASLTAFDHLVELALKEQAAFLLLAGDIYDGPARGIRAQRRLLQGLARLGEAGCETFIVHGNHDPLDGWSAIGAWPKAVHVFPPGDVTSHPVVRSGETIATVHGVSFAQREERENLARRFHRQGEGAQFGLLHCNVGDTAHSPYAPCTPDDLHAAGLHYWALGHVHQARLVLEGGPWAAYSGVLQGRSPAAGDAGPKGAYVLRCDSALGIVSPPEFVALDVVRFATRTVDLSGLSDLSAALDLIDREVHSLHAAQEGRGLVARLRLVGEFAGHGELKERMEEVLGEMRAAAQGLSPFLWWDELEVATKTPLRREEIVGRGDLLSELLEESRRILASPEDIEAFLAEQARELRRVEMQAGPLGDPPEPEELLRQAEDICLRLLVEEGDGR
ncbi:MAG: DNA repair exonuclease [Thermaerobacter sp.]|nr:DNA repair exonuclease [Thermaerobacter sp.]